MNQAQPTQHTAKPVPATQEKSKASWHRPTVTFVPLQATAFGTGSLFDGTTSASTTGTT